MNVEELFSRCTEMAVAEPSASALRYLHQTLVLACAEALRDSRQAFGNLFAQVDYLCKRHHVALRDRIAIQQARRRSNGGEATSADDWRYDVRALAHFISAVFQTAIPHELLISIPANAKPLDGANGPSLRYIRCVADSWDDTYIYATTAEGGSVCVSITDDSLPALLRPAMQLNLLDCHADGVTIRPGLVVVEPDYLLDISAVAACFQDYGHHPVSFFYQQLRPRGCSQPILLGNLAGSVLDNLINQPDRQLTDTLRQSFREQALQFCTCEGFDAQRFKQDAASQWGNIREAVDILFGSQHPDTASPHHHDAPACYHREKALLEPSFVCEQLGLQGRVDLMTTDMRLLVEQKSGKRWGKYKEDHYVQLLLYYGVLRYNFHLSADQVDTRLLYSKYPAREGLVVINYYQQLFREAISLRNRIVAMQTAIAREGFATILPQLTAGQLLENQQKADFFHRYIRPEADSVLAPLHRLPDAERDYMERMVTFVCREQLAQKVGVQEGQGGAQADLWHMPLSEKLDSGNILTGPLLRSAADTLVVSIDTTATLPNFRRGDMVYVYHYKQQPDVRANILYKGVILQLTDTEVTVRLNDVQQNSRLFVEGNYAVEHASSDIGTTSALRSIHAFCTAPQHKRDLLLGRRAPRRDAARQLSRSYHPHYDAVLQQAFQAQDYILLQGPPGTGKTSMALRFMVTEELAAAHSQILLMAYTNRAVDEICAMLCDAGIDFLRLGSETSCDPRFAAHLLDQALGDQPRLSDMQQWLKAVRVVVSTTSTMLSRPFLLQLKRFSLCIVDEASQILEPNIIGIISSERVERFILIGDHKQLPAVVQQPDDEPRLHDCRRSLFERLLSVEREARRSDFTAVLRRQGRMHPDIASFPNEMFYQREQLECVPCDHQLETSLHYDQPAEDDLDRLLSRRRVLFLPSKPCHSLTVSDKVNASEARIVADLLRRILRQYGSRFDADRTVGVIVPYRNQIAMIRHEIARLELPQLHDITIDTVERYQGSQRDVIIYSFTVQQPYQLDFLTSACFEEDGHTIDRKLNVAMTRARKQLLMTGHAALLRRNPLFAELIKRYAVQPTVPSSDTLSSF